MTEGATGKPLVAIVEDELMVAWALKSTVEDLGYQVAGLFADADAALARLLVQPVELVLMDINLGAGMDGVEMARRVKAAFQNPVIFISAYADPGTRDRIARAVPGAPLLSKPVQTELLAAAIHDALASGS